MGETELCTAEPVGRQASQTRYEYTLGDVIEAYDVRLEGLEQTFLLPDRPEGSGDLVIRGRVHSALNAAATEAAHQSLAFFDAKERQILSYGAATAVDARGRRQPMTTEFVDGAITLRLDAAWLETACYPLVVDPLIMPNVGFGSAMSWNGSARYMDILEEPSQAAPNAWYCYTRDASSQDQDLYVRRTDDLLSSGLIVNVFSDITTSWSTKGCQLGAVDNRVICVFDRHFGLSVGYNVRWHAHHVGNVAPNSNVGFWVGSNDNRRPDIGGGVGNDAMIVFQHEGSSSSTSEVRGFYLDFTGVTTMTSQGNTRDATTIQGAATIDCEHPHINRWATANGGWAVTNQVYQNNVTNDDWDVVLAYYNRSGARLDSTYIETNLPRHKTGADVDGSGNRYLVTYTTSPIAPFSNKDIRCQRVDYSFFFGLTQPEAPAILDTNSDFEVHSVAYETTGDNRWLVLFRHRQDVWAHVIGYRGQSVIRNRFLAGATQGGNVLSFALGSACAYDASDGRFLLFGSIFDFNPNYQRYLGNVWAHPTLPSTSSTGAGCTAATPDWKRPLGLGQYAPGRRRIGTFGSGVLLESAPVNSFALAALSTGVTSISLTGISPFGSGCTLLINTTAPDYLGLLPPTLVNGLGQAYWPVPLPHNLPPIVIRVQGLHYDLAGTTLFLTRRLNVPIER